MVQLSSDSQGKWSAHCGDCTALVTSLLVASIVQPALAAAMLKVAAAAKQCQPWHTLHASSAAEHLQTYRAQQPLTWHLYNTRCSPPDGALLLTLRELAPILTELQ